jgi:hypothetical protein
VSIYAGTKGHLDNLPVADVRRFEQDLLDFVRTRYPAIMDEIRDKGTLPDALEGAVAEFKELFEPSEKVGDEPGAEDTGEGDSRQAGGRKEATLNEQEITRPEEEVEV